TYEPSFGKETQRAHEESVEAFLRNFKAEDKLKIKKILESKAYYPQETFDKEHLLQIMKELPILLAE
ncbi:MAG: hypothetical protein H7X94_12320, partial [Vallitaleaceae bacterium]|nr:hypothetical protein [Vallitaleaceae bacterium]